MLLCKNMLQMKYLNSKKFFHALRNGTMSKNVISK